MISSRRVLVAACAAAAALVAPAAAQAATTTIDGDPLDVLLGDTGTMQARFSDSNGMIFSPSSDEPSGGFLLGVDITPEAPGTLFGFRGTAFTAGGQNPVEGAGTQADPFEQVSTFNLTTPSGQPIVIRQTATYANRSGDVTMRWDITNNGSGPTVVRPMAAADLNTGNDSGTGFFVAGPPRIVGGASAGGAASGAIVEGTPWAAFQEDHFGTVFSQAGDLSPGTGFQNTIQPELVDNGVGAAGPDATICQTNCAQSTTTFAVHWRFANFLSLSPGDTGVPVGEVHRVAVKYTDAAGNPAPGVPFRYTINGSNPSEGTVTTGADGTALIGWRGRNEGSDTLQVFQDADGDGSAGFGEPQRTVTVNWLQPQVGSTVVVEPTRGQVFVRLPGGVSPSRYGLPAYGSQVGAPKGFTPLTRGVSLPVRSIVNADRGAIDLGSAANSRGKVQTATFFSGTFQILQKASTRPVTEMVLKGGSFRGCPRTRARRSATDEPSADQSQRRRRTSRTRVRRLWGNGRGRFRTRGRYSAATVRGTKWLVEDRCGGTLTRVARRPRSSRVDVRDFARRKTIRLRAGRSYLALPRSARRR